MILRVSSSGFVLAPYTGHFNFIDTDCYYYMRRLVHFLANFPSIMVFDPLMDWPTGGPVDWPEGFLVLVGLPLKIFQVDSLDRLEVGVAISMIVLGLFTCAMIGLASCRVIREFPLQILVLLFSACSFLLVRFSCLGQVDHHIMEALFPPLVFILSLRAFEELDKSSAIGLGFLLTYSLSISSSSLFIITAFFGLYGHILGRRENLKHFIFFFLTFFLSLLVYAVWSVQRRGYPFADNYPSYFHVSLVASLGLISLGVMWFRRWWVGIHLGVILVAGVFYLTGWPPTLVAPLTSAFSYVFGKSGVLQNVSEAFPIYASYDGISLGFMHANFGLLVYLLPLVWVLGFLRKNWTAAERSLFFILSVISIPAIAQKRFSHLMVGLYLIFLVWVLQFLLVHFKKINLKLGIPLIASWALLTVGIPMYLVGPAPNGSPRDMVDLGASKLFLSEVKVDPKLAWDRMAGKVSVTEGIWANPNMGHMLLYYTGLGNVNNSFYHPSAFDLEFRLRNFESQEDFEKALIENKIRYLILADDWQFFELEFVLKKQSARRFFEKKPGSNGGMATYYQMPELMKLAWVRLLTSEEHFDDFKRFFSTRFQERHYYTFVRGYEFRLTQPNLKARERFSSEPNHK